MKILDLFSGIGTFSYAFEQVKVGGDKFFETAAFCEIDIDCHRVLKKHWPTTPIFTDVSKIAAWTGGMYQDTTEMSVARGGKSLRVNFDSIKVDSSIDIIVGGFPCTDISVAGKQKGLVDEEDNRTRSGLWSEYKRLIEEIKPRWVVIENVRNLLNNGIGTVLKDLSEIGYDAEWEVISARNVGQCHLRERLWIVAYPNCDSLRKFSERTESRRDEVQTSGKTESRKHGQNWHSHPANPSSKGLERQGPYIGVSKKFSGFNSDTNISSNNDERSSERDEATDLYDFRFWPTFTTEEEKQLWWSEATSEFSDWRASQPEICGVYDGLTTGLHEKFRRNRAKQLGNGIVRSIAQIIASRIAYHEAMSSL